MTPRRRASWSRRHQVVHQVSACGATGKRHRWSRRRRPGRPESPGRHLAVCSEQPLLRVHHPRGGRASSRSSPRRTPRSPLGRAARRNVRGIRQCPGADPAAVKVFPESVWMDSSRGAGSPPELRHRIGAGEPACHSDDRDRVWGRLSGVVTPCPSFCSPRRPGGPWRVSAPAARPDRAGAWPALSVASPMRSHSLGQRGRWSDIRDQRSGQGNAQAAAQLTLKRDAHQRVHAELEESSLGVQPLRQTVPSPRRRPRRWSASISRRRSGTQSRSSRVEPARGPGGIGGHLRQDVIDDAYRSADSRYAAASATNPRRRRSRNQPRQPSPSAARGWRPRRASVRPAFAITCPASASWSANGFLQPPVDHRGR